MPEGHAEEAPAAPPADETPITRNDLTRLLDDALEQREEVTQRHMVTAEREINTEHRKEVQGVKREVRAGIVGLVLTGIVALGYWFLEVRDVVNKVEAMPTGRGLLELIREESPDTWVNDRPLINEKIGGLDRKIDRVADEVSEIDDAVAAMRIEQRDSFRDLLIAVEKNGGGG